MNFVSIHEDYDLLIVTSAFASTVYDKWRWIQTHLPFVPFQNFITTNRKDLIQADILIDDAKHNVEEWIKTGRPALVPKHHWNEDLGNLDGVRLFDSWKGIKDHIDAIFISSEQSLMMWLDRRLEETTPAMMKSYVNIFKRMWIEEFDSLDGLSQEYKDKILKQYQELISSD